ncbi:hypothetical protein C1752_16678 [Acaryochloris thomasi RCC1774]|uniref:Uncharacterized protein n=1 Tax=Acaryochloris thomasi RCC1774 TaxID=1764569 RepID=A0A2W1JIX3_9CYAN|nr:hypothetical protein [Acaryochloris thomasi]PZD70214.1 hypothetical protein C1752_16678 [Acaryochloris thomasi RCC1774]
MRAKVVSYLSLQRDLIGLALGMALGLAIGIMGANAWLRAQKPPFEYRPQPSGGPITLNVKN